MGLQTLIDVPGHPFGEWNFRLFDVPVRVTIWFWIIILIIGGEQGPGPMFTWLSVCFVSILVHELGHVIAFRLFRERAEIVLYGWGGMAVPNRGLVATLPRFVVALAGPIAGFCVAALTIFAAAQTGADIHAGFRGFIPSVLIVPRASSFALTSVLWNDLIWVNLYWGLLNLLPVFPLDGGHAARAVFEQVDPRDGRRKSLIFSALVAGGMVLYAVLHQGYYLAIMFAVLAMTSLQLMDMGGQARVYRSPRR